jgi:hypothetical protein
MTKNELKKMTKKELLELVKRVVCVEQRDKYTAILTNNDHDFNFNKLFFHLKNELLGTKMKEELKKGETE